MAAKPAQRGQSDPPKAIQIDDDMAFQRRTWVVERVCWIAMAVLVVLALFGVFAVGPLSGASATDPQGTIRLQFNRFERHAGSSSIDVEVRPGAVSGDVADIAIDQGYAHAIGIQQVLPPPEQTLAGPDMLTFRVRLAAPGGGGRVQFAVKPRQIGLVDGAIGLAGQEPVRFNQFVYP